MFGSDLPLRALRFSVGTLVDNPYTMVTSRDIFFFDLQGYLHIKAAVSAVEVDELNRVLDKAPPLQPGEWWGSVQAHTYGDNDGLNLQHIYEAGEPFEQLIDHPSWIERVKLFVGGEDTFDWHHGPLFIDENFVNFRGPGEAIGMHSGGHIAAIRNQFRVYNGKFHCGQINILIALTNIGPGDGATILIPGSHKSNFEHPDFKLYEMGSEGAGQNPEGAVEVHMEAGDALLFADAICHGAVKRFNPDLRRIAIYRYGPSWGNFRHNYRPSDQLLTRLTPDRRQIVQPRYALPANSETTPR